MITHGSKKPVSITPVSRTPESRNYGYEKPVSITPDSKKKRLMMNMNATSVEVNPHYKKSINHINHINPINHINNYSSNKSDAKQLSNKSYNIDNLSGEVETLISSDITSSMMSRI